MRSSRVWLVTTHSSGPGTRPGGTMTALRGARWTGTDCGGDIALRVPGSADLGLSHLLRRMVSAASGAPEGAAFSSPRTPRATKRGLITVRLPALRSLGFFEGAKECRRARAFQKTGLMALGCLKNQSKWRRPVARVTRKWSHEREHPPLEGEGRTPKRS